MQAIRKFLDHSSCKSSITCVALLFHWCFAALDAAAETTLWEDNFDTGDPNDRWFAENGVWQIGVPTSGPGAPHSPPNVAGTVLGGNYPPDADSRLIRIQSFVVPAAEQNPRLRFWHWFSFFTLGGADKAWVELMPAGGVWTKISSRDLTDTAPGWSRIQIDLGAYAGQTVQIAFRFIADDNTSPLNESSGWYIDDVSVVTGPVVFNNPEEFELGFGDWSVDRGVWNVGAPDSGPNTAHSGTSAAGTILEGNHPPDADSRLVSPAFVVPAANQNPRLRFWHWYSFFSLGGVDRASVEVKDDTGNWVKVSPDYTDSSGDWTRPSIDLGAYAGQTVQIAFRFIADDNTSPLNESSGWYVDDVLVDADGLSIIQQPQSISVPAGTRASFHVTASGDEPLTYQWRFDGVPIPGVTSRIYMIPSVQRSHAGYYSVIVSDGTTQVTSAPAVLTVTDPLFVADRLLNLSTRAQCLVGEKVVIAGFVVDGTAMKRMLIRAVGPKLTEFGVAEALQDPQLELRRWNPSNQAYDLVASNDDWGTNPNIDTIEDCQTKVGAFSIADSPKEAVLLRYLQPGQYTATASGVDASTGVLIVELYDCDDASNSARLINISTRALADVGGNIVIPGFVFSHEGAKTFLIRVVGPTLSDRFGLTDALVDPELVVYYNDATLPAPVAILSNDNWEDNPDWEHTRDVAEQVGAFPLVPGSKDAAIVATLDGSSKPLISYTIHGRGVAGATGVVIVEVYVVP